MPSPLEVIPWTVMIVEGIPAAKVAMMNQSSSSIGARSINFDPILTATVAPEIVPRVLDTMLYSVRLSLIGTSQSVELAFLTAMHYCQMRRTIGVGGSRELTQCILNRTRGCYTDSDSIQQYIVAANACCVRYAASRVQHSSLEAHQLCAKVSSTPRNYDRQMENSPHNSASPQ